MYPRLLAAAAALLCALPCSAVKVTSLRCEGLTHPIAIQSDHPEFSWLVEDAIAQSAYRILVRSGKDMLWDSGQVSSPASFHVTYAGKPLRSGEPYQWQVRIWDTNGKASPWAEPASFRIGLDNWKAAWITGQANMPLFRRAVRLDKRLRDAILYIAGLGQYEATINGAKVGEDVLAPGWTNYRKTILYNTYDVTRQIKQGENEIGVMLGSGFFNIPKIAGRYTKLTASFGQPQFIAELRVTYADGTTATIATDNKWQYRQSPITFSHLYGGEDYDARLETANDWKPAAEVPSPGGQLVAQMNPPTRVAQTFRGQRTGRVYDLGQNMSGWPRITVRGRAGAVVKMIPGELLKADGSVSQQSSGGPVWYSYTLRGGPGAETWTPRFTYYGFRYLQIEPSDAEIVSVEGQFIHAAAPVTGEFSCSRDLFNKIHKLINAAIQSNMQSVMTDCPHREKLGWLEESHLLGSAIMYNYGVESLYEKIADDIHDSQTADGLVPDIAPEYTVFAHGFRDSPEWGSAVVLDPWLVYRHYGNRRNLARHYDDMVRYVDYLGKHANNGILSYGLGDWYDIGPKPPGVAQLTSLDVTATATYFADLETLRNIARLLGKSEDVNKYARQANAVRAVYSSKLLFDRGSQTAYAMPLALGLVPEAMRAAALSKLVDDVRAHKNHTTAGDIGFHYVIQALSEGGRSDLIHDMLSVKEPPSYAAQIAAGATTLTEAWDANSASSQNHFMLGHAEEWFYRYLAGIDIDLSRERDRQLTLRPTPVGDITWAKASLNTPWGTVTSRWQLTNGRLVYDCDVPPNTRATILLQGTKVVGPGHHRFDVAAIR